MSSLVEDTAKLSVSDEQPAEETHTQEQDEGTIKGGEDEESDGSDDSSEGAEEGEDPRIGKLRRYARTHTYEETVALLKDKIGAKGSQPAVIGESMVFSANPIMSYFMVEAVTDEDGDEPLSAQLKAKAQYFTALCGDDANMQLCVLCALERRLVVAEALEDMRPVLNTLYSTEIVGEDEVFEEWYEKQNVSRELGLDDEEIEESRAAADTFMEWLRTDEEEDYGEINVTY